MLLPRQISAWMIVSIIHEETSDIGRRGRYEMHVSLSDVTDGIVWYSGCNRTRTVSRAYTVRRCKRLSVWLIKRGILWCIDEMDFASGFRRRVGKEAPKLQKPKSDFTGWHLTDQELHVNCLQPNQDVFCDICTRLTTFKTCSWSQSSRSLANIVDSKRLR